MKQKSGEGGWRVRLSVRRRKANSGVATSRMRSTPKKMVVAQGKQALDDALGEGQHEIRFFGHTGIRSIRRVYHGLTGPAQNLQRDSLNTPEPAFENLL